MMDVIENIVENFNFNKVKDTSAEKFKMDLFNSASKKFLKDLENKLFWYELDNNCHFTIFRDIRFREIDVVGPDILKFVDTSSGRSLLAKIEDDNTLTFYPKTSQLIVILPYHQNFVDFGNFLKDVMGFDGFKIKTKILEIEFGWDKDQTRKYEEVVKLLDYIRDYDVLDIHEITFDSYEDYLKTKEIGKDKGKQLTITYTSKNNTSSVRIKQV